MNSTLIIYLWGILDSVQHGFQIATIIPASIAGMGFLFCLIAADDMKAETRKRGLKAMYWMAGIAAFFGFLRMLTPSSTTFAAMVIIPEIIESKAIQKDLPELYDAAVNKLKEELK